MGTRGPLGLPGPPPPPVEPPEAAEGFFLFLRTMMIPTIIAAMITRITGKPMVTHLLKPFFFLAGAGKVREAAIYGAGTWADERVAVSVSGQGELIIKSALARTIAEAIEDAGEDVDVLDILHHVLVDRFYRAYIIAFST